MLTASLLASVLLDHFGLMGFKQHPVTGIRGLRAVLLLAGIWIIAKFELFSSGFACPISMTLQ